MFFTAELLAKRDSGIGLLWMAATLGKTSIGKLNRRNILSANITKLCELVAEPAEPLALRLSSNLLVGVVRVYKVKHDIFLSEVTTCFTTLKRTILEINAAETSAAINLTSGSVRPDTITLNVPEPGTAMGLEMDFSNFMWQDFMEPVSADGRHSSPPGITSQEFTGTQIQTQTQNDRPLYTLDESYDFLTSNEPAGLDTGVMDLDMLGEDFDLGLGQDAFGDVDSFKDSGPTDPSSPAKRSKPKSQGATKPNKNLDPMYAREPSVPFEPLNLDAWGIGLPPSSSGFGPPGSGGVIGYSSRAGSVEPLRFQSREPQPFVTDIPGLQQAPEQVNEEEQELSPAAPKKPRKKKIGAIQDSRTELTDDELIAGRNNYLKEQKKLRIEVKLRRQERDASRVIDVWMEGVPYGFNCPALDDWFKQSFKNLTEERANKRKRDENDVFSAPPPPKRRQETPIQAPEIGRNAGTPMMNFGDEYNWGMGGFDSDLPRGSSVERGMSPSRHASQAPEDVNISQRSGLLPWDNIGISSSTNGDVGPLNLPDKDEHVTVRLKSLSHSRRGSSVALSRLSASPGRFGPGLDAFGSDAFELGNAVEERPSQTEVTLERNSFKFLEYARMQTRALSDPSNGVMFSSIAPKESSTAHVAVTAFYHTLVLATKSAVRVKQTEPFGDFAIYTL